MEGDPFSLLGLTPSFELDPGELETRYLARVRQFHPDRATNRTDAQPADDPALATARLNDARAILADPERRAQAARDYLVNQGVQTGRITTISYGKERPVDPRSQEEAWSVNRNAQTQIVSGAVS